MAKYEKSLVILTDDFLKSAKVSEVFALDEKQLANVKETREVSIEVSHVDSSNTFGPTFTVGNVEVTVPWSAVKSIIRILPAQSESKGTPAKRYIVPPGSSSSWMT